MLAETIFWFFFQMEFNVFYIYIYIFKESFLCCNIRAVEMVEFVCKYMDGITKSAKREFLLTWSSQCAFALTDYD